MPVLECKECGKEFEVSKWRLNNKNPLCCSNACRGTYISKHKNPSYKTRFKPKESHWNWRGGKTESTNGYVMVNMPDHPFCNSRGYVPEHRLVMETYLGRLLKQTEQVHHINGIRSDNRIENLVVFESRSEHCKHHKFWSCKTEKQNA